MRKLVVCLMLALSVAAAYAKKQRDWQEAKLIKVEVVQDEGGPIIPAGNILINTAGSDVFVCTVETKTMIYTIRTHRRLNVTANTKVQLALDGLSAWMIDESGKEVRFRVLTKSVKDATPLQTR